VLALIFFYVVILHQNLRYLDQISVIISLMRNSIVDCSVSFAVTFIYVHFLHLYLHYRDLIPVVLFCCLRFFFVCHFLPEVVSITPSKFPIKFSFEKRPEESTLCLNLSD
jgi:hypothetical protein